MLGPAPADADAVELPVACAYDGGGSLIQGDQVGFGPTVADGVGGSLVTRQVFLHNAGAQPLTISGVSLSGSGGFSFDPAVIGATIAAGERFALALIFDPSATTSQEPAVRQYMH